MPNLTEPPHSKQVSEHGRGFGSAHRLLKIHFAEVVVGGVPVVCLLPWVQELLVLMLWLRACSHGLGEG